jgi:hypothetical protein
MESASIDPDAHEISSGLFGHLMMRREDTGRGSTLKLFWPLGGIR